MDTSKLSFTVSANGPDLRVTVIFDGEKIHDMAAPLDPVELMHEFRDIDEKDHTLEIEMSGKKTEHTKLAPDGSFAEDRLLRITGINLDGVEIDHLFSVKSEYHHDFNGTSEPVNTKFFKEMGCNGKVIFKFTSPAYLWLLQNT